VATKRHKKVTLQDIADIVGISKGTVDRAIHNRSDINEDTKRRILEVAKELNYTPNRAARSLALKGKKKIGIIIRSNPSFYWDQLEKGVLSAYHELQDYGIDIVLQKQNNSPTPEALVQLIDNLLTQDLHALILVPIDSPAIKEKIHEITKSGIKLVTLNDDIETDNKLFYLGPHMQKSGKVGAKLMGKFLRGRGNIITINGSLQSYSYQRRLNSFREELNRSYPNIHIIANYNYDHGRTKPYNEMMIREIIKDIPDLKGIYNVDGASLYETGCALEKGSNSQDITLIGHEIWDNVIQLIQRDVIDAVINQDPYNQGYYAVRLLYYYLVEGKTLEFNEYYTKMDIVVKENLSLGKNIIDYTNDIGFS
jgi:LacI family transcriptional regulator